jgi:hypothetical protein
VSPPKENDSREERIERALVALHERLERLERTVSEMEERFLALYEGQDTGDRP